MSQTVTVTTGMKELALLKAALTRMGIPYFEDCPIPNNHYFRGRVNVAISGDVFGEYRGVGYALEQGLIVRKMDEMDMWDSVSQKQGLPERLAKLEAELELMYVVVDYETKVQAAITASGGTFEVVQTSPDVMEILVTAYGAPLDISAMMG